MQVKEVENLRKNPTEMRSVGIARLMDREENWKEFGHLVQGLVKGADLVVRSQTGAGTGVGGRDADPTAAGGGTGMSPEDVQHLAALDGVASADGLTRARAALWAGGKVTPTVIESLPAENFRWQDLTDGHYPQTGTEVVLGRKTMDDTGLGIGDRVTMGTDEAGTGEFTVVGEVDTRGALDYTDTDYAVVTP